MSARREYVLTTRLDTRHQHLHSVRTVVSRSCARIYTNASGEKSCKLCVCVHAALHVRLLRIEDSEIGCEYVLTARLDTRRQHLQGYLAHQKQTPQALKYNPSVRS